MADFIPYEEYRLKVESKSRLLPLLAFSNMNSSPSKLCVLCTDFKIVAEAIKYGEGIILAASYAMHRAYQSYEDVYPDFPDMEKRAADGCNFCAFLRNSLLSEYRKARRYIDDDRQLVWVTLTTNIIETLGDESTLSMYKRTEPHPIQVQVRRKKFEGSEEQDRIYSKLMEFVGCPGIEEILNYEIALQISSEPTITNRNPLAKHNLNKFTQWLQDCDANHPSCSTTPNDYTPTRLLMVKGNKLRLITRGTGHHRYVALSYCWGQIQPKQKSFLLTKSNITARLSGFSIKELPQTLGDAVKTVQALGLEYIWIDALCIIQDDHDDWAREASVMNEIYKHAYLTIAVTVSQSSFDGFLQDRRSSCKTSVGFTLKGLQPLRSQASVDETGIIHFRHPFETSITKHLSKCQWEKRGWTLQEKLLSNRILYFTEDVVYYECAEARKIEDPGYSLPQRTEFDFTVLLARSKNQTLAERVKKREEYLSSWYEIIGKYTGRNLTNQRDKLPAMEGLAATFEELVNDEYIYGLWKSDLHRGLLWHSNWMSPCKPFRGGYRAPTWSWASRDGKVRWEDSTLKRGWKSLIKDPTLLYPNKCTHCNETRDLRLELVAPMVLLKDVLLRVDPPNSDEEDSCNWWTELDHFDNFTDDFGRFEIDDDDDLPLLLDRTYMVLVAEHERLKNIQAILVQPYNDSDVFRRMGWFIHKDDEKDKTCDDYWIIDDVRSLFKSRKILLL